MRPLPQLTPFNEWFWTSGSDGALRIQGCTDCRALVHPPVPVCPYCRSRSWEPTVVSGRGTVVAFTVNHQRWLPGFEPPYVIANVALADFGGKALFVKELEEALLDGRVDVAVHSLKDMPAALPAGLTLAAFPPREDPADALIGRDAGGLAALPAGARVGTHG